MKAIAFLLISVVILSCTSEKERALNHLYQTKVDSADKAFTDILVKHDSLKLLCKAIEMKTKALILKGKYTAMDEKIIDSLFKLQDNLLDQRELLTKDMEFNVSYHEFLNSKHKRDKSMLQ